VFPEDDEVVVLGAVVDGWSVVPVVLVAPVVPVVLDELEWARGTVAATATPPATLAAVILQVTAEIRT